MTYRIKIAQFEGPFDLLLFFIERDELDIHDIPIAKITSDFLDYIRHLESLDIDVASEFIVVAATLMRIKARMLLPRKELDEEGNEIDPREELVQKLLEYKAYKEVLDQFREMEEAASKKVSRGYSRKELDALAEDVLEDAELEALDLFKLMKAFENVMARFEDHQKQVPPHSQLQLRDQGRAVQLTQSGLYRGEAQLRPTLWYLRKPHPRHRPLPGHDGNAQ